MTIGETLKRARHKMGLELEDVARTTKIAKMFLIALEDDDLSSLPSGVYARNFLRTYARYLKLDEDIITAEFHEQYNVVPVSVVHHEQTRMDDLQFRKQRTRFQLLVVLFLILLLGGGYFLWDIYLEKTLAEFSGNGSPVSEKTPAPVNNPLRPDLNTLAGDSPEEMPAEVAGAAREESVPSDVLVEDARIEPSPEDEGGEPVDVGSISDDAAENVGLSLPVENLDGIVWTQPDRPAGDLDDMFALQAISEVWVEVYIDGERVSFRLLPAGTVRFYRYGDENRLMVGRPSSLAIQAGGEYRARVHKDALSFEVSFPRGGLMKAIDEKLAERLDSADQE